ncbi:MAG: L,D-transpeptidase [Hyphomicrobiaceae bacterium]
MKRKYRYPGLAILSALAMLLATTVTGSQKAKASVVAKIDLSSQRMNVYVNGRLRHRWKVSTGRRGYITPRGSYRAKWLSRHHRSRKYNNAPMPYAIFFRGGYAIHGTNHIRALGRRASHGCVRLHPRNASRLFSLVRRHGLRNSRVVIKK